MTSTTVPYLPLQRGIRETPLVDIYTDDTHTERITFEGWRFVASIALLNQTDLQWATDDDAPLLTVVDVADTDPVPGQRLQLALDATVTAAFTWTSGTLTVLRIDPDDATNVDIVAGPNVVRILPAP